MAHIRNATLETVTADCDVCGAENVLSRRDDVRDSYPYVSAFATCNSCGTRFRMTGDTLANTFEFLLWDADARFDEKRYNACVVALGQVWESFMRLFAASTYAYHPFVSDPGHRNADDLNTVLDELRQTMQKPTKFAFDSLRHLVAHTTIQQVAPANIAEAKRDICRIAADGFGKRPPQRQIDTIANPVRRELINKLYALTIGDLRNKCVHHAYVPTRTQTDKCREEEIVFLFTLKREFHVGDFHEIQCGAA